MAKMTGHHPAFLDALRAMGIEPNDTRKVIIEVDFTGQISVYVQQVGNDRVPEVVKTVGESDLHVVWGPAKGGPVDKERLELVGERELVPLYVTHGPGVSARRTKPGETIVTIHRGDPKEQEQ